MIIANSPIDSFNITGKQILVKRDDLLDSQFNGNKARKLAYYLTNNFPDINTLISYGGTQSNMLVALSYLAKLKNYQFIYYCYPPSEQALMNQDSNLATAIANGTQLIYVANNLDDYIADLTITSNQLLIHQGGRQIESLFGIQSLANEINEYAKQNHIPKLAIFTPSGTGSTAFYLQNLLPQHQILTTNCVGSTDYLLHQWSILENSQFKLIPTILPNNKFRFATPHLELWTTIKSIQNISNIEFDLVYDPVGWNILLEHIDTINIPLMYIHCGGISGNSSMKSRYKYLFKKQNITL